MEEVISIDSSIEDSVYEVISIDDDSEHGSNQAIVPDIRNVQSMSPDNIIRFLWKDAADLAERVIGIRNKILPQIGTVLRNGLTQEERDIWLANLQIAEEYYPYMDNIYINGQNLVVRFDDYQDEELARDERMINRRNRNRRNRNRSRSRDH